MAFVKSPTITLPLVTVAPLPPLPHQPHPYEEPLSPEVHIHTDKQSVEECVAQITKSLQERGLITKSA